MNIEFEGSVVVVCDMHAGYADPSKWWSDTVFTEAAIEPGDTYMAKRNTGWHMLTCREVIPGPTPENGLRHGGWICPVEDEYPYDLHECFKVLEIIS